MQHSFPFFFEFLATYETQKNAKNATYFYKERKRTQRTQRSFAKNTAFFYKERKRTKRTPCSFIKNKKNAKNATFFCKEQKRTQRTPHSYIKNGKERKNVAFFWKEQMPNPACSLLSHPLCRVCPALDSQKNELKISYVFKAKFHLSLAYLKCIFGK